MKIMRILGIVWLLIPCVFGVAFADDFQSASKLLVAARRGDIQTVQVLINSGVDVNYVDSTGLSLVCTAVMNNDTRAIQILQMYGADASVCDRQIKQYQQRQKRAIKGEEYGFFSGLSSSHVLLLSAVGVAAVIGGVVLLPKLFDDDKGNNNSSSGSGSHSGGGGGGSTPIQQTKLLAQNLPYGPACSGTTCPSDFTFWEGAQDFAYMSDITIQDTFNYLMVARAYNAFVRGYLGMETVRITSDLSPFDLSLLPYTSVPGGGKPVNVAMITGTGVNATGSAVSGNITWVDSTQISTVQSICTANGSDSPACQAALAAATKVSNKYFNLNTGVENTGFDLTDSGTVFGTASVADTKLAKIIAGWEEGGRATPDFYGFIPNGQLTVYKVGNGITWQDTTAGSVTGSYDMSEDYLTVGDTFTLANGTVVTVNSIVSNYFVGTDSADNVYEGYLVGDNVYISYASSGNTVRQLYTKGTSNSLTLTKETTLADYKNYSAIYDALVLQQGSGSYISDVVVNLSLTDASSSLDYLTVGGAKILDNDELPLAGRKSIYGAQIDYYYNLNTADDTTSYLMPSGIVMGGLPSENAKNAFEYLSNIQKQILINPAGYYSFGVGIGQSVTPLEATFENYAPAIYSDLENLFMTVVALKPADGTRDETIAGYSAANTGKLELAMWADEDDATITYSSRMCGLTGTGNDGAMNPWCFAAPGVTNLDATASMAGAVASVKSAFNYMTPNQIFLLLALTADGPYLGTNPATNTGWTDDAALISYLRDMYSLPGNMGASDAQYLESFKNAYGYGMINLERATRPGTNVYFYGSDTDSIVSGGQNAYWRSASHTTSLASSVLSLTNRGAIKASFYDVLESADGTMSLPRVWNMEFVGDNDSKHGLYMGDVLADFSVDSSNKKSSQVGNFTFDMALSPRAYDDGLNGLDDLHVAFSNETYDVDARYQRFLTDGRSRFDGRANGVLSLVADSVATGARYKMGNFSFGGRAFSGSITDEVLLENDPVISSQFEPARLGLANGVAGDAGYNTDHFAFNLVVGNLHETNTVLGMYSDGILTMRGGDTQYIDAVVEYKPWAGVNLFARTTFANTRVDTVGGLINNVSDIKSNAFAIGADIGGFGFTAAMPLATVSGKMGYSYAEFEVVEDGDEYTVAMNNPHVEYVDLAKQKREFRFSSSYKHAIGEFTDAGVGFIYRVNPNNTDAFGNESIFMFKMHHRLGI